MRRFARAVIVMVGVVAAVEAFLVWAFRSRNPWAIQLIRRFNKHVLNPIMVRFSGRTGFYAATLQHVGRRSGTPYATPVLAHHVHEAIVIPLPYGTEVDWLHNLLAAGRALLDIDGRTITLDEPAVVPIGEVADELPSTLVATLRLYGTDYVVRARAAGIATPASA